MPVVLVPFEPVCGGGTNSPKKVSYQREEVAGADCGAGYAVCGTKKVRKNRRGGRRGKRGGGSPVERGGR